MATPFLRRTAVARPVPGRRDWLATALIGAASVGGWLTRPAPVIAASSIRPTKYAALIVVDVQNCFVDGGTLPVKGGADVVPVINRLAPAFRNIVITQDWHSLQHSARTVASSVPTARWLIPLVDPQHRHLMRTSFHRVAQWAQQQ